ncbi:helix-turn-helix transcriptional regulator [Mycolicibacillus parakoreensis]|uniref:Helix-turn-helix domain-containing protein n=1 Tax=Mycolicibacillus parakoreensis TaxID=1069221 RepID=A0ABY3U4W2_9MYCO|nr:helix-turn-helix transcriptional regulator [Mycolicibacillus parakoreensis]MCV7316311.1 helix-turn-helix transcriptional regulator [Mycolicibacillus parakoreensis]ULN52557.1 helix-turn-helix domain-containing protein [Mycolicibacillus parakoreensis]
MGDSNVELWPSELSLRLGEQIEKARRDRGMSAVKLAEATNAAGVGIHRVAITRIERGEQAVTVPELVSLGKALNADWVDWLVAAADGVPHLVGKHDPARVDLRAMLITVEEQLETMRHSLFQAEEGPKKLRMPDAFKERLAADAERYRASIASLEDQRNTLREMLGDDD